MSLNKTMNRAIVNKKDEFYTSYATVEKELPFYKNSLKGKIVYCNCDDYRYSNFYKYLKDNFKVLGLKKLLATNFDTGAGSYKAIYNGESEVVSSLEGGGSYDSEECLDILKKADIVITNPPFSLFKDYLPLMLNSGAKVLVLGNNNAITYSDIFPFIRDGELWLGVNSNKTEEFMLHHTYDKFSREDGLGNKFGKVPAISWFTNLTPDTPKETVNKMSLKEFVESEYRSYDNYDAIEVVKVKNIPYYKGVMGVPITYLSVHCPDTFKIVGSNRGRGQCKDGVYGRSSYIDGKETFKRIFIQLIGD